MRVYCKRYIPSNIENEFDTLEKAFFERHAGSGSDFGIDDLFEWVDQHSSEELKAWKEYSSFTGDEGQLLDKDGTSLLDEDGYWIQDWAVDDEGCLIDLKGAPLYYSDGTRIKDQNHEKFRPYIDTWFPEHED